MLIEFHRNMLADKVRNDAFYRALKKVIKPGKTTVADIGAGTGVLGMMAAKLGAKKVYLYEFGEIFHVGKRIIEENKIKNCEFIQEHSTSIIDPPKVDVVVSEVLGNFAFEENMISTIQDAKRFLKPGGIIIPSHVEQYMAPVTSPKFFKELSAWDDVGFDIDFSMAKLMSFNNLYVRSFKPSDLLDSGKSAQCWDDVDFRKTNSNTRSGKAKWKAKKPTKIYGVAVWWNCKLVPGIELSTSPSSARTHWEQLYFPVMEEISMKAGDVLEAKIHTSTSYESGSDVVWELIHKSSAGKIISEQNLDLNLGYIA